MTLLAGADQRAIDRHRLDVAGVIAYCPVCRRPATVQPSDAGDAFARLARHLAYDHDPYFLAQLRIHLDAAARETATDTADPYYPTGSSW